MDEWEFGPGAGAGCAMDIDSVAGDCDNGGKGTAAQVTQRLLLSCGFCLVGTAYCAANRDQ